MSFNNEISNVLRFHYKDTDAQAFRQERALATDLKLMSVIGSTRWLLPFQIKRVNSLETILLVQLYDKDDNLIRDITADFPADSAIEIYPLTNGYDYIQYFPVTNTMSPVLPCGYYYIKLFDTGGEWWVSELIYIKDFNYTTGFQNDYLRIDWKHSCNLADNYYEKNFINRIFIDSELAKPEELIEREEHKNELTGITTYSAMITAKIYKFTWIVPEYVYDALRTVWMNSLITLYKPNLESSTITEFSLSPSWNPDDGLVTIEVRFKTDIVVGTNCCTLLTDCCFIEVANVLGAVAELPAEPCTPGQRYLDVSSVPYVLVECVLGVWTPTDNEKCNYVSDGGLYWYYYDGDWYAMDDNDPDLESVTTVAGNTRKMLGVSFPYTNVQAQYKVLGVWTDIGSALDWSAFNLIGLTFDLAAGTYDFRFVASNLDLCEYTSNELSGVILA